jgi:hypothetical protein
MTEDFPRERPLEGPSLSAQEFQAYLDHIDITPNEAARLWAYDPRRVRKMLAGSERIPPIIEILLRTATALQGLKEMIENHLAVANDERLAWFAPRMELADSALEMAIGKRRPDAMAIKPVTPHTLEAAPRHHLTKTEQAHAASLVDKGHERGWTEPQRRYAAQLQVKAHAIENGTWGRR